MGDKSLQYLKLQGFRPRKGQGQHFLINKGVLTAIVREACLSPHDVVIEVGTGPANLTEALARNAGHVFTFETDRRLSAFASQRLHKYSNVTLLEKDFLSTDLTKLLYSFSSFTLKAVANLPYTISSPVLFSFLESRLPWELLIFMVQKEFGARLLSPPGKKECSPLSLATHLVARVAKVIGVSRGSFHPSPKVDSVVVKLTPRDDRPDWETYQRTMKLARMAFQQRRKKLSRTLKHIFRDGNLLTDCLKDMGLEEGVRPENLTRDDWLTLEKYYKKELTFRDSEF